ncbi:efflux RND transporter periplasmic adaptor subunit [Stieleria sp. JC731]|uniref:efflux RND transporter periplasmic adaptor subunit n=1 Tax=Pirellulaceae TaxID=2691357 RepID=UPI001E316F68|nr:efflux RND transporter periplasmic adaptor subunit [Stieleria sp. JC731]MCC9599542.1 efflux RND transporter periplasmic adaptor subunit [Stieleria sp. JC731]
MNQKTKRIPDFRGPLVTLCVIVVVAIAGLYLFTSIPASNGWPLASLSADSDHSEDSGHDESHEGHDHSGHDHEGHSEADSIELSDQARANLRLTTTVASVQPFSEYVEIPGVVTPWPGRTHITITSPLTGVINSIRVSRGELVASGTPLFTLRLTHQDLVQTQEKFLTSLGQLDVEEREIRRLSSIASSGAIAANKRIEREYERDRLLASIQAARQSMLLHGLNVDQINQIERTRELVREVTVYAPILHTDRSIHHDSIDPPLPPSAGHQGAGSQFVTHDSRHANENHGQQLTSLVQPPPAHPEHVDADFLITDLLVSRGQSVQAGETLCQLSDYSQLLIEGSAFQRDSETLRRAADREADLQAVVELGFQDRKIVDGLKIVYLGNEVDRESRALPFYVMLGNEVERSVQVGDERFVSWRYKPGQRLTIRVPLQMLDEAIVVPKEAVAEEGPERYVFVENDHHFDRVSVHVLAQDSVNVAIANDGQLWPGQTVAVSGSHQLQMAIKNKSGGAIDPHAGHNH